ncbi:MAG: large conductance mechanosensitive channel [Mycobacterium sp.]|jgi:large conductance mechanosensitive channel|nr:large conductance mechanosensitive channel [Mycobacterium sp.]MDT5172825.1 large conductance mechanosensitive channel [Mycobacterium sp.]MDT5223487.1 large conductance mechanosensitive channel [Mycobacterium sp.]
MLKGFKEFLARGNIVDLSVAVVIGAAFTTVVKSFTDGVVNPLVSSIGAGPKSEHGLLKQPIPGTDQFINLNDVLSAAINFIMVAAVVYFLIVLPYNKLRKKGEVEQADDAQVVLLEEIRDLLAAQSNGSSSGKHGSAHEAPVQLSPPPEYGPRSDS